MMNRLFQIGLLLLLGLQAWAMSPQGVEEESSPDESYDERYNGEEMMPYPPENEGDEMDGRYDERYDEQYDERYEDNGSETL